MSVSRVLVVLTAAACIAGGVAMAPGGADAEFEHHP